ncbi:MAG TPA: hypothetical protein PLZ51_24740, partial [Aggregatilineales bacterium]|nr:hypothetical protein [Aggregatilineales bacterium]
LPQYVDVKQNILLTSNMFTVPMPEDEPTTMFFHEQIIHFGFSMNHFDVHWHNWLEQFEELLRKLYWVDAYVYLSTMVVRRNTEYYWKADTSAFHEKPPRPIEKWEFKGGPRDFGY